MSRIIALALGGLMLLGVGAGCADTTDDSASYRDSSTSSTLAETTTTIATPTATYVLADACADYNTIAATSYRDDETFSADVEAAWHRALDADAWEYAHDFAEAAKAVSWDGSYQEGVAELNKAFSVDCYYAGY